MKKEVTKIVTACDYCEEEIVGNSHRFSQPAIEGGVEIGSKRDFDLHAECMKKLVVESLLSREAKKA